HGRVVAPALALAAESPLAGQVARLAAVLEAHAERRAGELPLAVVGVDARVGVDDAPHDLEVAPDGERPRRGAALGRRERVGRGGRDALRARARQPRGDAEGRDREHETPPDESHPPTPLPHPTSGAVKCWSRNRRKTPRSARARHAQRSASTAWSVASWMRAPSAPSSPGVLERSKPRSTRFVPAATPFTVRASASPTRARSAGSV